MASILCDQRVPHLLEIPAYGLGNNFWMDFFIFIETKPVVTARPQTPPPPNTGPQPVTKCVTEVIEVVVPNPGSSCNADKNTYCRSWASRGECRKNPAYMLINCCKSCGSGESLLQIAVDLSCRSSSKPEIYGITLPHF